MVIVSKVRKVIGTQCWGFLQFYIKIEPRCGFNTKRSKKVLISKFISLITYFYLQSKEII